MGRRIRIKRVIPDRGFPYEAEDEPMVADHVADAWVEEGYASELTAGGKLEAATAPQPTEDAATRTEPPPERTYEKRQREDSPGWWDVVDSSGEPVNEKALREDKADALLGELGS